MNELLGVYAAKHKDSGVRAASRSGGVFTALSDEILKENGAVFGCVLADDFLAYHVKAETAAERDKMRGSKYIQSDMGDTFREVRRELESGRRVLFSGTSCQTDGLRCFLGGDCDNLLCVDIVCHGVPSPKVWSEFLRWQQEKNDKKIVAVDFRNKTDFGWTAHVETLYADDGTAVNSTVFKELFFHHDILRPACYECRYKNIYHPSDITLADFWGIEKAVPGFSDNKGVSLVLINSDKGKEFFERVIPALECVPADINDSMQPALQRPCARPKTRDDFWKDYSERDFDYIARKYARPVSPLRKFLRKCKKSAKHFCGRLSERKAEKK